jgi:hypothetical protein
MSVVSEKVRVALFEKMNVSGVTSLAKGGVWHLTAPAGTARPFVVFNRMASAPVVRAFDNTSIAENDVYLIKAVSDEDSSQTMEPQALNAEILNAVEQALGHDLTLSGGSVVYNIERENDIPEFTELSNDRLFYHSGFMLRVWSN